MLCFMAVTCEILVRVKRAIRKAILHKLPIIYNEYMRLCWVSTFVGMVCLFFNWNENSTTQIRSKCNVFICVINVSRPYVPLLLAMQWGVASRFAFCWDREIICE